MADLDPVLASSGVAFSTVSLNFVSPCKSPAPVSAALNTGLLLFLDRLALRFEFAA